MDLIAAIAAGTGVGWVDGFLVATWIVAGVTLVFSIATLVGTRRRKRWGKKVP